MENNDKVVSFADCKIEAATREIAKKRELTDYGVIEDEEERDIAIDIAIRNGNVTVHKLVKLVLDQAEAIDILSDKVDRIMAILEIKIQEGKDKRANENKEK